MHKYTKSILSGLLLLWACNSFAIDNNLFPRPPEIEPDVKFWVKVFGEINSKQGFIHDDRYLNVVYEKINLPVGLSRRAQQKYINQRKKHYERILKRLGNGNRNGLTQEEQRVLQLWPTDVSNRELRRAPNRLRFQLGQADKYLAGLKRSGAWKAHILNTLEEMGLPREISSLPHVESSFNPKAYSKVGAAGLWQFTRSTGRRFMRIDHIVDERMDPFKASVAAARLLENNYAVTGTWPLALTAYNHGAAGMRNAARRMGTTDIATILRKYKSRTFKFASRNFYVAFLAAVEVEKNAEKYFGKVELNPPIEDETFRIPAYMAIRDIQKALGLPLSELKAKNPALRPSVWSGQKYVPRGYELRIGKGSINGDPQQLIAGIAASKMYAKQKPDLYHRVRRGQTLSTIARRYGVSVRQIMAINNLRSRHRIYVGQKLRLPQRGGAATTTMVASTNSSTIQKIKSEPPTIPENGIYKVRRGDSIHKIARRFGVSKQQILALNNLKRINRIYPGQKLRLTPRGPSQTDTMTLTASAEQADTQPSTTSVQVALLNDTAEKGIKGTDSTVSENIITETDASPSFQSDDDNVLQEDVEVNTGDLVAKQQPVNVVPNLPPIVEKIPALPELVEKTTIDGDQSIQESAIIEETPNEISDVDPASIAEEAEQESEENLDLAADPSDYSVSNNKTIEVQAAETLGHYAEWLNLRASQLRRINRMRYGKPVVIGKRIKLDFSRITPEEFEQQRKEYHRVLQEEFFTQYEIAGSEKHVIRRGDSLWRLAKRKYKIPLWLLRQYNPDLSINNVKPGTEVTFPRIEERSDKEASKTSPEDMMATNN